MDAVTSHLLDSGDDGLGSGFNIRILVLHSLREEWNGVIKQDQVSLADSVEQVLDDLEGPESDLGRGISGVHENVIVDLLPHVVIVNSLDNIKDCGLDNVLNKVVVLSTKLGECHHGSKGL